MSLLKRTPRKLIRCAEAAAILQVSRTTIKRMIASGEIKPPFKPVGTTSPVKLYEADVRRIAERMGIL
jgi:excisionase family DNA binding protein